MKKLRMVGDLGEKEVILAEYRGKLDGLTNIRIIEVEERCREDSEVTCCG